MTPAEGFLLSRIDGRTAWAQLRQIGGIPPEEADRCLARWLSEGIITLAAPSEIAVGEEKEPSPPTACDASESGTRSAAACDSPRDGIHLSDEQRRRILEFESFLDRPYHEILGVERNADSKAIKRAYFALSKEFHPDRHFGRELGSFGARLDRIFKKLVEAYELLSDPATRAEVERSMSQGPPPGAPPPASDAGPAAGKASDEAKAPPVSRKRAALERLRRHFRIPETVMTERRFKAREFYQAAMIAAKKGRWQEAGASVRLAIAFDPWNDEYKQGFASVQSQIYQLRATELLEEGDASWDANSQQQAMRMYEEALSYQPCDPVINDKAARLAYELGELDAALEYAETACEMKPETASYHHVRARILHRMGMREKAKAALDRALELDPEDEQVKAEIESLRRGRRRAG